MQLKGKSLFIFGKENAIRKSLSKVVIHQSFEMFIFFCVLLSSILMAFEKPLEDPSLPKYVYFEYINMITTGIFLVEMVIKVIVYGFIINGSDSYLKLGWNILDFVIVVTSIVSITIQIFYVDEEMHHEGENHETQKHLDLLKMLRVLRSLRMISKNEGLKLSVMSLIYSIPGIVNVGVVSMLCLYLIGIFFLNLLKGKLYYCTLPFNLDDHIANKQKHINNILAQKEELLYKIENSQDCMNFGGIWKNSDIHYDDIMNSMFSLFVMCTIEGWVTFMYEAVDSVGIQM